MLSLDTGHARDYSEGAAYREDFGTDRLMFSTSRSDRRLRNKAEILALRLSDRDSGMGRLVPVAIAADFLARHPVYQARFAGHDLVVITSAEGANRVYDAGSQRFRARRPDGGGVEDHEGTVWRASEEALEAPDGRRLRRIAAHRAFWFGWYAQYPDTLLVKMNRRLGRDLRHGVSMASRGRLRQNRVELLLRSTGRGFGKDRLWLASPSTFHACTSSVWRVH